MTTAIDVRSAGNAGHGPSSTFGIAPSKVVDDHELLVRRHADPVVTELDLDAQTAEHRQNRPEIVGNDSLDRDLATRHGGHADEAADLDVLGPDRVAAAEEALHAGDVQHVRTDAVDLGAERDEEPAQVLHMRLGRGVRDHGLARSERRRHDCVLGGHHRGFVQMDVRASQPARQLVPLAELERRTQLGERMDVRVEPAPADDVAARRRYARAAETCKQGARKQE